jgi:hypothetical protein
MFGLLESAELAIWLADLEREEARQQWNSEMMKHDNVRNLELELRRASGSR